MSKIKPGYFIGGLIVGIAIGLILHSLKAGVIIGLVIGILITARKANE